MILGGVIHQKFKKAEAALRLQDADRYDPAIWEGWRTVADLLHYSRAENFIFAQGFKGGSGDSRNRDCVTDSIENLDGIAFRAVWGDVMLHQLHNIAAKETMLWQITGQHRVGV